MVSETGDSTDGRSASDRVEAERPEQVDESERTISVTRIEDSDPTEARCNISIQQLDDACCGDDS